MAKLRKSRTDSLGGTLEALSKTGAMVKVPNHVDLCPLGLIFWSEIIDMKPAGEWTPHELSIVGALAQTMALADEERKTLKDEGFVLVSASGNPCPNPRATILHGLDSRVKSMRQSLNIHGRAREGEARDAAKRRGELMDAAGSINGAAGSSDLLAN